MTYTIMAAGILLAVANARSLRGARSLIFASPSERSLLSVYDNEYLNTFTDDRMKQCLVFTAPHTLYLNDESRGGRRKKPEIYTDLLAKDMAQFVGGGYITWKKSDRDAARKKFEAKQSNTKLCRVKGKSRGKCKKAWAALNNGRDPTEINRDVNYLTDSERKHFGFMKSLHRAKRSCAKISTGKSVPQMRVGGLHVDVHGMSDATAKKIGQHFVIGTRAMETRSFPSDIKKREPKSGVGYNQKKSLKFRKAMANKLNGVLKDICNKGQLTSSGKCTVAIGYDNGISTGWAYKPGEHKHLKFLGDWGKRNTLSRISTEEALWGEYNRNNKAKPFGCAVQVELSAKFRKALYDKNGKTALGKIYVPKLARGFAEALKEAGCA